MKGKNILLAITVTLAVIMGLMSVSPQTVQSTYFKEVVDLRYASSSGMPTPEMLINGMALSGRWEGPGHAEVYLVTEEQRYLVVDTRKLPPLVQFDAYGIPFEAMCLESCAMPLIKPEKMIAVVYGPGVLSIDEYHYTAPTNPTGLAFCPNCERIEQPRVPNHSLLLPAILLALAVIGAHIMGHCCTRPKVKKALVITFFAGFILIIGIFGVAVAAPTGALSTTAKHAASVASALGVIAILAAAAFEVTRGRKSTLPVSDSQVWSELEEAEKKWLRK